MIDDDLETTRIFMQNTVKPFGLRFWYPFFFFFFFWYAGSGWPRLEASIKCNQSFRHNCNHISSRVLK